MGSEGTAQRNILTFQDMIKALAKDSKLPPKQVGDLMKGFASMTVAALEQGKEVKVRGLGTIRVREGGDVKRIIVAPAKPLKEAMSGR